MDTRKMSYTDFKKYGQQRTCPICKGNLKEVRFSEQRVSHMTYLLCQTCHDIPFYCDIHSSAYIFPYSDSAIRSGNLSCKLCGSSDLNDGVFMME